MSSGTCWHCEGDHDTGDCPTRKQWTKGEHQPGSPGVDLDEIDRLHAKCTPGPLRVNRYDEPGCIQYQIQSEARGGAVLGQLDDSDTPRARWDAEFFALVGNVWASISTELRTLRARVGELEAAEHALLVESNSLDARAESAEARVKELEAAADRNANVIYADESVERYQKRITDLESQLAAAREEQGLEAKVREALRGGFEVLKFERMLVNEQPAWFCDTRIIWPHHSFVSATTLPALLRAILEVEAKGG
jgi:hypothetical protein